MQQAFRQLEERNLPVEVTLMEWSPKMDLIALANENGEVRSMYVFSVRIGGGSRICEKGGPGISYTGYKF